MTELTKCKCKRPLKAGEKKCPHCEARGHERWKPLLLKVGGTGLTLVASVAIAILTKGKFKPKA